MADQKKPTPSENKSISINGDVKDSIVSIGDNNIFQKIVNYIFPSEKETLEQRNRRILLNHVENAWIKGVLDASLHGAAMLELGIKQDPDAVTKYPWALKTESTDETLPAGTSMLAIFDSIGMGRSLLILGAPGSGKTTMLLELARGQIARAREDVTQPIPMVFNLSSWTESKTLADWLAQELNNLYSVPRKTAPDWVKGNKLLLLLDGLDEVRQDSRAKCVEAINEFKKQNGLTSLAVCSRSQDYADLNAKLSFEGAIEVQPLTQEQVTEFFNLFGEEMKGIKQALEKDSALRQMAETPLFLSIIFMAYRNKRDVEILVSGDEKTRRKHLFDTYIERMFERRLESPIFKKNNILHWLSWLASKMVRHGAVPYLLEDMQPEWLEKKTSIPFRLTSGLIGGIIFMLIGVIMGIAQETLAEWMFFGFIFGLVIGFINKFPVRTIDRLSWSWVNAIAYVFVALTFSIPLMLALGIFFGIVDQAIGLQKGLVNGLFAGVWFGISFGVIFGIFNGIKVEQVDKTSFPSQKIIYSIKNSILVLLTTALCNGIILRYMVRLSGGLFFGLVIGIVTALYFGGIAVVKHHILRFILAQINLLPWRLVPFLDHCVDMIFLRRVGGGYIFIHRLLMEHFAEMYVETPTQKGNQK